MLSPTVTHFLKFVAAEGFRDSSWQLATDMQRTAPTLVHIAFTNKLLHKKRSVSGMQPSTRYFELLLF